jgi:hypothetical protein
MGRRGVPAYTVDDEVKGIVSAVRGEIAWVKHYIRHTDHELGAKAAEILEGKLDKMDWLAHNAFKVLATEGDVTGKERRKEDNNSDRQDKVEAMLCRVADELSDPMSYSWCDEPEDDRKLLESLRDDVLALIKELKLTGDEQDE